ncbi:MAG: hypothetical protein AAB429_00170 [Patescibacteria group bacterium]
MSPEAIQTLLCAMPRGAHFTMRDPRTEPSRRLRTEGKTTTMTADQSSIRVEFVRRRDLENERVISTVPNPYLVDLACFSLVTQYAEGRIIILASPHQDYSGIWIRFSALRR